MTHKQSDRGSSPSEIEGVAHVPFAEETPEDEDRCSNMAHKRYRMFGCTECLDEEATSVEPIKGGQLCHLCNAVHDLMSACPPKETK